MNFKKGDVVVVSAIVRTMYLDHPDMEGPDAVLTWWKPVGWTLVHVPPQRLTPWRTDGTSEYRRKCLLRHVITPKTGLVVGYTRRATGYYHEGTWDGVNGEGAHLQQDKRHEVVMVEPMDKEQWVQPWVCLPEDLRLKED